MEQYKIVFGVFDREKAYDGSDAKREFTELFESIPYSREEMLKKMQGYIPQFKERHLDTWIMTAEKPQTFVDGDWDGWRLYKL